MKREELKSALSQIQPREELIEETVRMLQRKEQTKEQNKFSFARFFSQKWVGAVCTCALLVCVSVAVLPRLQSGLFTGEPMGMSDDRRQMENTGDKPSVADPISVEEQYAKQARVDMDTLDSLLAPTDYEQWVVVKGTIDSCRFLQVTDEDADQGVAVHAIISIGSCEVIFGEEQLQNAVAEDASAYVAFAQEGGMNAFSNLMSRELYFKLVPDTTKEGAALRLAEFSEEEIR